MFYKNSAIITGGTNGMGYHAALEIAKEHPDCLVVIASRSDKNHAADAINQALGQSNTMFMALDLGDPIQALVMNAALQFPTTLHLTDEGMEKTFAISHVGHAILFHLLCPYLATGARVVITSSGTHDPAQKSGLPDAEYSTAGELAYPPKSKLEIPGRKRYSTTKLCNVLWAYALARHLDEQVPERRITVNTMDPGLMPGTGLAREGNIVERWLWNSLLPHIMGLLRVIFNPNVHHPAESAAALARLAVSPDVEGVTGKYFEGLKEIESSKDSYVKSKQDDLWEWTINYVAGGDAREMERLQSFR